MSWIPVFKVGLGNAWILSLFLISHPLMMNLVDKAFGDGKINQKMGDTPTEKGKKKPLSFPSVLLILLFIFSIIIPLQFRTLWLYIGLGIYITGIAIFFNSIITAVRTPLGHVFTHGMYRYSRHPLYLSFLLIFIGISLASLSWVFLFLSMLWMAFPLSQVNGEEQGCLKTLGGAYQEYMCKTSKWLGIPKSG